MKNYKKISKLEISLGLIAISVAIGGLSYLVEKLIKEPALETQLLVAQCSQVAPKHGVFILGKDNYLESKTKSVGPGRHTFMTTTYTVIEGPAVIDESFGTKIYQCPEEVISDFKFQLGTIK